MAVQYEVVEDTLKENIAGDISAAASVKVGAIIAASIAANPTSAPTVATIEIGDILPKADEATVVVISDGYIVETAQTPIIVAAPNAKLEVKSIQNIGQDRAIIAGNKSDSISTSALSPKLPQKAGTATDDNILVEGAGGDDTITTGSGNDTVFGGQGNDSISTGSGNDSVIGGAGNDSINTGAGNDLITIGSGADSIDAGSGIDIIKSIQQSTEVDFTVDAQGRVTLTDKSSGDISIIDNAEYLEFSDGAAQFIVSNNIDNLVGSSLVNAFTLGVDEGGLKAFENLGNGISSLVSNYINSSTFKTDSANVTDINFLAGLVYKGVFGVEATGETLNLWSNAIKTGVTIANNKVDDLVGASLVDAFTLEVSNGGLKVFESLGNGISALVSNYVNSNAFKSDSSAVTDVDTLANLVYNGVFGVNASGATLNLWSNAIKAGFSNSTTPLSNELDEVQIVGFTQINFDEI